MTEAIDWELTYTVTRLEGETDATNDCDVTVTNEECAAAERRLMPASITNHDGGIVSTPEVVAPPTSVGELQKILRDEDKYPGPVRAMGSITR